jgi:hypothetical protein
MVHHALLGRQERAEVGRLLALLAAHENARCVPLSSLVGGCYARDARTAVP